jgi:AbrB family looped-hinge helix DNA binding protein
MIRRYSSSVSPKGQITLPIEIRRELDIDPRDRVDIQLVDGQIRVIPRRYTVRSAAGAAGRPGFKYVEGETERIAKDEKVLRDYERMKNS